MSVYFLTYVWLSKLRMWENSQDASMCERGEIRSQRGPGWWIHFSDILLLISILLSAQKWGAEGVGMQKIKKNMFGSRWKAELKLYRRPICSRVVPGTSVQWCAGKYLTNGSPENKNPCSAMAANFHSINTPPVVNFKLPTWPPCMQIGEEMWSCLQDTRAWPFPSPSPRALLRLSQGNWPGSVSEGKWQLNPLDSFAHTGSFTSNTFLSSSSAQFLLQVSVEICPGSQS